jgi:hypothetical protein
MILELVFIKQTDFQWKVIHTNTHTHKTVQTETVNVSVIYGILNTYYKAYESNFNFHM